MGMKSGRRFVWCDLSRLRPPQEHTDAFPVSLRSEPDELEAAGTSAVSAKLIPDQNRRNQRRNDVMDRYREFSGDGGS
jgi:hypothetical protein